MNPMNSLINTSTLKGLREDDRKIATVKGQPTPEELKGQKLYHLDTRPGASKNAKPTYYGKVEGVYLTSGIFGKRPSLEAYYQCSVDTDDSMFELHHITKVGGKFVYAHGPVPAASVAMIDVPNTKTKPVKKAVAMKAATVKTTAKTAAAKAPAKKVVAIKPATKKVAAKPARAKKVVVRVPRKPRMTNDQRQMAALNKFAASKLVSGLIATYVREQGEKIVTHVDQPEVKAVLNRDVFVRDAHTQKLVKLGRVESALVSVSSYDMGLFNIYTVWVDDGDLPLHQIRKIGTKFVFDASLPMPNKRQTHLVDAADFDKARGKKKKASDVNPQAEIKREEDNQRLGYKAASIKNGIAAARKAPATLTVRERNDLEIAKSEVKLTKVEGELSGAAIAKGTAVIIDSEIRGDVIKTTKILIEGKGTKRSPFVKRRYIFTEKGQKCPVADLKIVRGKLRNVVGA